ncbi:VWA domain-containing protein [uncultured Winogradskyella sp.]|uniref:VWA domain-containing protein n=1 Tax=uncultured Winogradskyella sp. TaxID=395353 RepID=UPI00262967B5|nr:VWA domain-containing protein [uncultured Winogradskyella sp.]
MASSTIIYLILSGILALLLALFQYVYKTKYNKLKWVLSALRFIAIFSILILLINPKFEAVTYYEEKPNLVIALDNSESIAYLKQDEIATQIYNNLSKNTRLLDRFDIKTYKFGNSTSSIDSLDFKDNQSNFSSFFKNYNELYKGQIAPVLIVSDGNQTLGNDYLYSAKKNKQAIFPVILGDTTNFSDLRLQQVNVNRFAYLKNRFPVEVIVNYSGEESVSSQLKISSGNTVLFSKNITLDNSNSSEIINTTLNASQVGVKTYKVEISPLENEKNTVNNYKNFGVEIIDQKTNIALVADGLHPDIGALKKSIESNEQRSVSILKPRNVISKINDFQLVILYQPNNNFKDLLDEISRIKLNTFTITGNTTDFDVVNNSQVFFSQEITNQSEDFQPAVNTNYGTFIVDNISFDNYPPLQSEFGSVTFKVPEETLLFKTVNGVNIDAPLLSSFEANGQKYALLSGEGIWRWRAQSYLDTDSFSDFDNFIGKLVQYLSSNKKRNRLNLDHKSFYNQNETIVLSAQFFNKNYEFDSNANLQVTYKNNETNETKTLPLLLKNASYRIDLSGIAPGDYSFTVKNQDEPVSASGGFKVLAYNVEQQFLNADVTKLNSLATSTNGKSFYSNQTNNLVESLLNDTRYATIQKSKRSTIPIIDWKYLLGLIALALSLEWFIRKYNGLI